jgi:hypothetical protein
MSTLERWGRDFTGVELDPDPDRDGYVPLATNAREAAGLGRTWWLAERPGERATPSAPRPGPDGDLVSALVLGVLVAAPLWIAVWRLLEWAVSR